MRETRKRQDRRVVEVDSGRRIDYESKLADALQDLRQQHEGQVKQYKDDMEHTFQAKVTVYVEMKLNVNSWIIEPRTTLAAQIIIFTG